VRIGRQQDALADFKQAHERDPADARIAYVYAVALNSLGQKNAALDVTRGAVATHANDPELLQLLITLYREQHKQEEAAHAELQLRELLGP
jgi:Flp pilus assembly protein TadD